MAFTDKQVGEAISALAVAGGDAEQAATLVKFKVPVETLTTWRDDTHAQRYLDSLTKVQKDIEAETIQNLRTLAKRATEIEAQLLERAAKSFEREVPQNLRAVADVKAKSIDKLMALTGRSPDGAGSGGGDMRALLETMAAKGLISVNVNLEMKEPASAP